MAELPAQRLGAVAIVVMGNPNVTVTEGSGPGATTDNLPMTSYRRVPATLATRLGAIPGVRAAIAERSVPLALDLPDGRVVTGTSAEPITGYGWPSAALTPFRLRVGHAPAGARGLVLGAGLARRTGLRLGDKVRLAGQGRSPFTIAGIAAAPPHDPAGDWSVFFSEPEATARYGHPGQVDLIGIVAQPGTSPALLAARVRAVSGQHLSVLAGSDRGTAADLTAATDLENLSALGGGAGAEIALISLFVVASTVALAVAERARMLALLRAVGATPGQVRRMVMAELAALGVLAGLVGYLPGTWLAAASVRGLAAHQFIPPSTRPWTTPWELLISAGAAIVVAELSGLLAARRASRIRPAAALAEASIERRSPRPFRLVLGLGALGGGVVLAAGGGHLGTSALGEVLVSGSAATRPAALSTEIAALSGSYPGIRVASRTVANAQDELLTSQTSYLNDLLLALIGLLAAVALVNTLVVATLQSREELALLRRVGATAGQLLAMTTWQAAEITLVGVLLGAGAAAVAVVAVTKALTGSWLPYLSWAPAAVILGPVVLLTGLAMLAPTTRMLAPDALE
jgi:putative ABC transport system permease protein